MATNVTQKDKTLQEVIDWASHFKGATVEAVKTAKLDRDAAWGNGYATALGDVIAHCKAMLGYGCSMPLEVPNQAEDAK